MTAGVSVQPSQGGMRALPTRRAAVLFGAKVAVLRLRRAAQNCMDRPAKLRQELASGANRLVGWSSTPLWSDPRPGERAHQLGKVHNLRQAVRAFDGVAIPAGATFSFWRQLGPATSARGFVDGRMLKGGCMLPAVGGGLCQLSNALHDAALQAGCTIVERHAHSHQVPGSTGPVGRDATVAWNYVDLRFRPQQALHLHVELTRDDLVLRLTADSGAIEDVADAAAQAGMETARTCGTCVQTGCFRHERGIATTGRPGVLLDELWPEFMPYLATITERGAWVGMAFSARLPPALQRDGTEVSGALLPGLARSVAMRLAAPGASVRRAAASGTDRIARSLSAQLPSDATDLWVAQSLLPSLWRDGHLGGRRFSVLMTRPPMSVIQARLDAAITAYPERNTLADYRADPAMVEWEMEALAEAETIVTPHADVALMFPGRAVRLPWHRPAAHGIQVANSGRSRLIAFPGPTLARKGAYEIRQAAKQLGLTVAVLGSEMEGSSFWDGVTIIRPRHTASDWLNSVAAVVQPALVEEQPRLLLMALAAGVPVLATPACGLDEQGVVPIRPLDGPGLVEALEAVMSRS